MFFLMRKRAAIVFTSSKKGKLLSLKKANKSVASVESDEDEY